MTRRLKLVVVAGVLGLALAGGIAYAHATSASTDGSIAACAKTDSGQLRLDTGSGCLASERSVQFGSSTHADERYYVAPGYPLDPSGFLAITTGTWPSVRSSMTHVLTLHLPAGTYTATAEVLGANYSGVGVLVCLLGNPTVGYAVAQSALGNAGGYAIQQTIDAQSVFPLPQGGDLELSCFNAPQGSADPGTPSVAYADVIATGVATFTSTREP
jgi:hypothetical protein